MPLTSHSIRSEIPLNPEEREKITSFRKTIHNILLGLDRRKLLIVGPCSIHEPSSALLYAQKLQTLSEEVADCFFIVMRSYFEKSRSSHGWKGLISDPRRDGSNDILLGIRLARTLLKQFTQLSLPAGLEFLDPLVANYLEDFVSWGSIGARTAQSQTHRQLASSLKMPIGFKNTTDGNFMHAIDAARVASRSHTFLHLNTTGTLEIKKTTGNIHPHIVLRGGDRAPNCDAVVIEQALQQLKLNHLSLGLIIDCSHGNSQRNPQKQKELFRLLTQTENSAIKGFMLESHLRNNDDLNASEDEISITDPCLDWEATESIILEAYKNFSRYSKV